VSSRTDLPLKPSAAAGLIAAAPWLILAAFLSAAAATGKTLLLLAIAPAFAGAFIHFRRSGWLRGQRAVTHLSIKDGLLTAKIGDRPPEVVDVTGASRLGTRLALLKLRPAGTKFRAYTAILLTGASPIRGNVPVDEFRRLRVWLRLGRPAQHPAFKPELE